MAQTHEIDLLHKVPLNWHRHYRMAKTKDGCEVYMPVATRCSHAADFLQATLQQQLDEQDLGAFNPEPLEPLLS